MRVPLKRAAILGLLVPVLVVTSCLNGCAGNKKGDKEFVKYTDAMFRREMFSDTVNLHFTLKNPEDYGIDEDGVPVSFGEVARDSGEIRAAAENVQAALLKFDYGNLSEENKIAYEVINYSAGMAAKSAPYLLYEEPLGTVSGVQTQLPVILSEYQFYDREDVDTYLELISTVGDYFGQIIEFEKEKSKAGLFMADYMLETVLEQCQAFLDMGIENYLYSTFVQRVNEVETLNEKEKSDYIQKNASVLEDYLFPAYENLMTELESLSGTGRNDKGLAYFDKGKEYYEQLARCSTGSDRTVEEMEALTRKQMEKDLEAMERVIGGGLDVSAALNASEIMTGDAQTILSGLREGIGSTFPSPPDTALKVKYVPEEMQEHLSPAFYMIPALDNIEENVIYINPSHMKDRMTLFTTLAHEGYPGHLYQTIYYEGTDPLPIRSVFHFGGYIEGWATYAEMCSYYLAPIPYEQKVLLQKNSSIILGLYALADMGIHYEGWSRMDTVRFFKNFGIDDAATVEYIYELIIGSPANYLKYYIGYVEFLQLKEEWADRKGEDFSQKEFHEAVLGVGPAPFEIVERALKGY